MSSTPLTALVGIISQGVQHLEFAYSKHDLSFPSLDEPFKPGPLDNDPELDATTRLIVAAAYQIIATVRTPLETIQDHVGAMYSTPSLGLIDEADVADALKDAGSHGLHVNDISTRTGIESVKLSRVLRYLASRHVFQEVTPDVYANNRISSILIKSKPLDELKKDKLTKYEDAPAAAWVGHVADECLKGAAYLGSYIKDEPTDVDTPWNLATGRKGSIWQWYKEPDNVWRYHRFTAAMKGGVERFPSTTYTGSFDWKSLATDSVVVDVGGSVGKVAHELYKVFPHLKYVIQDLPPVLEDARNFWNQVAPDAVEKGRTIFSSGLLQPQATVKEPAAYLLRFIIHDWPDNHSIAILKNLRAAAGPATRLVLFEGVMPHVCLTHGGRPPPPPPLLGNLGAGMGALVTMLDLQMLTILNGQERTIEQFRVLGNVTGWNLEAVNPGMLTSLVFTPA
ncbi:S-adenosyl-L-methionine-dependent methyltransferase [Multifurca ochricompacta]|uniref:S-adenosyl-L-methionine-dependent methyltransferase n=1 Tax=Multifurca ochricompacta TaxID=376703 RepID=A0AAD4LWA4_9AGAM|nr:S-adenosyl-L-methionine-dependent methyltransferase [Multifurca ochricompacta]